MTRLLFTLLSIAVFLAMGAAPVECLAAGFSGKIGVSMSKLRGNDARELDGRAGIVLGIDGVLAFSSVVGVQPGLFYVSKGAKLELRPWETRDEEWYHEGVGVLSFDYLEIPILLRFSPRTASDTRPYLLIGPTVAYKVGSKAHLHASAARTGANVTSDYDRKATVDLEKDIDFGVMAGIGLKSRQGNSTISLEVRYMYGLAANAHDLSTVDRTVDVLPGRIEWDSGTLTVMAGLEF